MQMNSTRLREKDDLRGKKIRKKRGETRGRMEEEGLGRGGGR